MIRCIILLGDTMIRTGRVQKKERNLLEVCFEQHEQCSSCGLCGRQAMTMSIKGTAEVGDWVDVELPDAQVLKASMLTYAVPLVGLILGLWLGSELFPGREAMSLLTALIGAVIFFAGVRLVDRTLREKAAWQPRIIAVRPADGQEAEAGDQSED